MAKKSWAFVLFMFALMIIGLYLTNIAKITGNASSEDNSQIILRLEKNSNAHGGIFSSDYGIKVKYDNIFNYTFTNTNPGPHVCDGNNSVLVLTGDVNAHAEFYSPSKNYTKLNAENNATYRIICYGDLICRGVKGNCASDETFVLALDKQSDAHMSMNSSSTFAYKLCCKEGDLSPAYWRSYLNGGKISTAKIGEPVRAQAGKYSIDYRATNFSLYKDGTLLKSYNSPHNYWDLQLDAGKYYFEVERKGGTKIKSAEISIGGGTWNGTFNCGAEEIKIGSSSHEIMTNYQANDTLKGWINLSLKCADGGREVRADYSGYGQKNISYTDLVGVLRDSSVSYNCTPISCRTSYIPETGSGAAEKSFSMTPGSEKYVGMMVVGRDVSGLSGFRFVVESNAPESCASPFEIDVLNDDKVEVVSTKKSNESCDAGKNYGCGTNDLGHYSRDFSIGKDAYCEIINLSIAPAFEIGAYVKKGSGNPNIVMSVYDSFGDQPKASCNLDLSGIESEGETGCVVNYVNTEKKSHYVCIYSAGDTDYRIVGESFPLRACGFYGWTLDENKGFDTNYKIYAQSKKFATPGEINVNSSNRLVNGEAVAWEDYISAYVRDIYFGDCSKSPCIIPIKIKSNVNQNIKIRNAYVDYQSGSGRANDYQIYSLKKIPPMVSTGGFAIINIDPANVAVPGNKGKYDVSFKLGNKEIFKDKINVETFSAVNNVTPGTAIATIATEFTAEYNTAERNITTFKWNFGDNTSTEETSNGKITHTFTKTGKYELGIVLVDSNGKEYDAGSFEITAIAPKELTTSMLTEREQTLDGLNNDLKDEKISSCYKNYILSSIDSDGIKNKLATYKSELSNAASKSDDAEFIRLYYILKDFKVPRISITDGQISYSVTDDNANGELLSAVFSGTPSEDVNQRIVKWNDEKIVYGGDYRIISADYNGSSDELISVYNLKISKKSSSISYDSYLFIDEDANLVDFCDKAYGQSKQKIGDAEFYSIKYNNLDSEDVSFLIKNQSVLPENLHVFVSPKYELLPVLSACNNNGVCDDGEDETNCPEDCKKPNPINWTIIVIILAILGILVLGGLFYWWYKNKYEDFLFKNKTDLRNLINFIENAQRQRLDKKQIVEKLKANGWKSSQINYAFKKAGSSVQVTQKMQASPSMPPRGLGRPGFSSGPRGMNGKVLKRGPPPRFK